MYHLGTVSGHFVKEINGQSHLRLKMMDVIKKSYICQIYKVEFVCLVGKALPQGRRLPSMKSRCPMTEIL